MLVRWTADCNVTGTVSGETAEQRRAGGGAAGDAAVVRAQELPQHQDREELRLGEIMP